MLTILLQRKIFQFCFVVMFFLEDIEVCWGISRLGFVSLQGDFSARVLFCFAFSYVYTIEIVFSIVMICVIFIMYISRFV